MSDLPIPFIVGVPRSGTTLLRLMFDSHPDLCIPPETHFLLELLRQNPNNIHDFIQLLEKTPTFPDFDIESDDLMQFISSSENIYRFDLSKTIEKFYEFYSIRNNKKRFGDKTPAYLLAMPGIQLLFRGRARFIHIIRDGRDVFLSLRDKWFGPGDDLVGAAQYWRSRIEQARYDSLSLHPDSYIEVKYEDLVRQPENVLRNCANLLILIIVKL